MKNTINNTSNISKNFDKELAMILKSDLKAFRSVKSKFLSNNSDNKEITLLVA